MTEEIQYKLLKILGENPAITQRELAAKLGVSLGKANYCLRALMTKGWVKATNFRLLLSQVFSMFFTLIPLQCNHAGRKTNPIG